jgi:hypothetical protein
MGVFPDAGFTLINLRQIGSTCYATWLLRIRGGTLHTCQTVVALASMAHAASLEISRAKALVRFPGSGAAWEAAREKRILTTVECDFAIRSGLSKLAIYLHSWSGWRLLIIGFSGIRLSRER